MKYILTSLILLSVMLGACLFSYGKVTEAVDETTDILETAVLCAKQGNNPAALTLIKAASDCWERHETFFGTVLRHDEIDDVLGEFARLTSYAATEDPDDFLSNCAALLAKLEHIKDMEWPTFKNIM